MYDENDVKRVYNEAYWTGLFVGVVVTFLTCLLVGVYID